MKKFISKLLIYVLIVSSITIGVNLLHICLIDSRIPGTMGSLKTNGAFIKDVPDNIQICNFGSSHSYYGFNYVDTEKKYTCFNFALASQTLRYDCKILEHYRDKLRKGATVFIVVSYFSFFGKPGIEEKDFASENKRYYKFLPPELIDQYDSRTAFYVKYLPALTYSNPFALLKACVNTGKSSWNDDTVADGKDGFSRYEFHVATKFDENGKRIIKQEAIDAIYKMIALCREIGATPIMITTPYLHEYVDATRNNDPQFFSDFHTIIDSVKKNTGIKYYDYSEDKRFSHEYSLFTNVDHLNGKGARIFTNTLMHETLGIDLD